MKTDPVKTALSQDPHTEASLERTSPEMVEAIQQYQASIAGKDLDPPAYKAFREHVRDFSGLPARALQAYRDAGGELAADSEYNTPKNSGE